MDAKAEAGGGAPLPESSRLARGLDSVRRRVRGLSFGVRLFLALVAALAIVGWLGHELISNHLHSHQLESYGLEQKADAEAIEEAARGHLSPRAATREVDGILDSIGRRPGTVEAALIGPDHIVRASNIASLRGTRDVGPRIDAALSSEATYAGHEADPGRDSANFEFVTPVDLPGGRNALEVSVGHDSFDAQLDGVRRILLLVALLAIVGVIALFYLLGGRSLLRSHRLALHRATRDGLTDLPNHRAFQDEFGRAAAAAGRLPDSLTLALLDLDHFKLVNDRHGHPQGDALLRRVAAVIGDGRSSDRAYRIGGDEFALLLPHTDVEGARVLVRRLSRALGEADASVSIGVATMREGQGGEELRAEADAALYEAKRRGGKRFVDFEEIRDRVAVTTTSKREAVRSLIDDERLTIVYQPIWNLAGNELIGIEALTRPDPSYELSGPAEAFDIAEQIGRVHELDELCATRAVDLGAPRLPEGALLFVNMAPKTLELDGEGNDWLLNACEPAKLPPERVVVEVTERIGARTVPVVKSLRRLRGQGFKLALDDVGTGNAGLEMLREVDAEFVKLDRSIVAAATTEPNARAVLMAMATFARQTGAFVIAEGIEDEETLEFLRNVKELNFEPGTVIQGGQGFELGRPSLRMPTPAGDRRAATAVAGEPR